MGTVSIMSQYSIQKKENPELEDNSFGQMYRLMVSKANLVAVEDKAPVKQFRPWEDSQTVDREPDPRDPNKHPRNPLPQSL